MTGDSRIERSLPLILEDLGAGPDPDYTEFLLARTAAASQRPGWAFPERWFPMYAVSERVRVGPRLPLRAIAVVAILMLALVAAAVIVGSRQPRLAPYGPADNGLVVYDFGGDIFVGDLANTDKRRQITSGPGVDSYPGYSHDGTKIVFIRSREALGIADHLMVVNADGTGLRQLTTQPLREITGGDWSGDGRSMVITSSIDGRQTMTIFDTESGAARTLLAAGEFGPDGLPVSMPVSDVSFRPPDGDELMFVGEREDGEAQGIYVIGADGSNLRPVVSPTQGLQQPHWSPDGSRIAYGQYDVANGRVFTHVVGADGRGQVVLDNPPGVIYQVTYGGWGSIWSPDGTSVLVGRGYWNGPAIVPSGTTPDAFRLAILSVDGTVPDQELNPSGYSFGSGWGWSPDGTKVIYSREADDGGLRMVDIATEKETLLPGWYRASWQRAPSK